VGHDHPNERGSILHTKHVISAAAPGHHMIIRDVIGGCVPRCTMKAETGALNTISQMTNQTISRVTEVRMGSLLDSQR
jgi:hypothetical protein